MCLLAGTGQSPIYNEPLTAWSRAHARWELDCCSPRQGGPLPSKHCCTAQGLTTTTAAAAAGAGIDTRNTDNNTDTPEHSEYDRMNKPPTRSVRRFSPLLCACFALFPCREDISRALTDLRYSGRPVEGAASRAANQRCGVFNQKAPSSKRPHLLFSARAGNVSPPPICPRQTRGFFAPRNLLQSLSQLFSQARQIFLENRFTPLLSIQ